MDAVLAELVTGLIRTDRPWFLSRLVIHPSSAPSYLCIALVSTNCSILVWDLVSWFRCQASGCCRHTCATNISRVSVVAFDCSCFSPSSHSTVPHSYLSMVVLTWPRTRLTRTLQQYVYNSYTNHLLMTISQTFPMVDMVHPSRAIGERLAFSTTSSPHRWMVVLSISNSII